MISMDVSDAMLLFEVRVVKKFADVFLNELPGLPPIRQTKFAIDLQPGTTPISNVPYGTKGV